MLRPWHWKTSLLLLAIAVIPFAKAQESARGTSEKQALKIRKEINEAISKGDANPLKRLLAEDIVWLTPRGEILTKAQVIAGLGSGVQKDLSIKPDDTKLQSYGSTVVIFDTTTERNGSTRSDAIVRKITDVFVKQDGSWKMVAHGATIVIPQADPSAPESKQ